MWTLPRKEYVMKKNNKEISGTFNELDGRYGTSDLNSVPGINNPEIALPAFNPPVPNRAWTAMREELGKDLVNPEERE